MSISDIAKLFAFDTGSDYERLLCGGNDGSSGPVLTGCLNVRSFQYVYNSGTGVWDRWTGAVTATVSGGDNNDTENKAPVATGLVPTASYLYGFDSVNWDRLRAIADGDNVTAGGQGVLRVLGGLYGWDGAGFDRIGAIADADNIAVDTTNARMARVGAQLYGFDGTNNDRARMGADNADGVAVETLGILKVSSRLVGFDGTDYDRLRCAADNADGVATEASGVLKVSARLMGVQIGAGTWTRVGVSLDNADGIGALANNVLRTIGGMFQWNGATYDRVRGNSAAEQSAANPKALNVALVGNWGQAHLPAVNTIATTTRAAPGAGLRHVVTSITLGLTAIGATGVTFQVTLADSSGTLWGITVRIDTASSNNDPITISGLSIVCAANSAVTLAFSAAAANVTQSVSLTGYTAN